MGSSRSERRSPSRRRRIEQAIAAAKVATLTGRTIVFVVPPDLTTEEHDWIERELGDVNWMGGRRR